MNMIMVLALSIVTLVVAALAHDVALKVIAEKKAQRLGEFDALHCSKRIDDMEVMIKKLADDWRAKFVSMEHEWQLLEKRAQSQFSGAIAQVESQNRKGFGR